MYGWESSPTKAELKHINTSNGISKAVYKIGYGSFEIAVPIPAERPDDYEPPAVTWAAPYRQNHDVKSVLPNLDIDGDTIRIPVTDLVPMILDRLDPTDLARALWQNDDVKRAFMDCLVTRYNELGIGDHDRRSFLEGVQEAVHSKSLDTLAGEMASIEYALSKRSYFWDQIRRANDFLHHWEIKDREGKQVVLDDGGHDPDFKIAGTHWNERRDFWRAEVLKQFPMPPEPAKAEPATDEVL